jgi:hypothetical protein
MALLWWYAWAAFADYFFMFFLFRRWGKWFVGKMISHGLRVFVRGYPFALRLQHSAFIVKLHTYPTF